MTMVSNVCAGLCLEFFCELCPLLQRCIECRRGLAMRILSVCPSVCLTVRLSVKRVLCDEGEERSVQIFISYKRPFSLVF